MMAKRNRPAGETGRLGVLGDAASLPPRNEAMPSTTVLRTFPPGHKHPRGVVVVCPVCGVHHWLRFELAGDYTCPFEGVVFVADVVVTP